MRRTRRLHPLLTAAVFLAGAQAMPALGQGMSFEALTSSSTLLMEGDDTHLELRSGDSPFKVPGIEFRYVGDIGFLALFPPDSSNPERLVANTEGLYFQPTLGADFPLLADGGGVVLASDNPSQRYLADANNNDGVANHIWYENKVGAPSDPVDTRMMQLTEEMGGTLYVDGPVVQNHTFDLAETFWESEPIRAGELVAIDPKRPDAVRRTSGAYQQTVLGVASNSPGFLLGGAPFSLGELESTWGQEIVEAYLRQRPALELDVFAEVPELAAKARRLESEGTFYAHSELLMRETQESEGPRARALSAPTPAELAAAYQAARSDFETTMFDRTLSRFFGESFSAVALAGRVPVKVDANFGAILPGDFLTSSPIAGVAMKASDPGPVIGTALEAHTGGEALIQVFVHRGWYGGEGARSAGTALASRSGTPDARDRRIAALEQTLLHLESKLAELTALRVAAIAEAP